jgi:hypothetical protein
MRSKYIYLIFRGEMLMSAHTVKHEAHAWLQRSQWLPGQVTLRRMPDGVGDETRAKDLTHVAWDPELYDADHRTQAASQVEDWPEWAKRTL